MSDTILGFYYINHAAGCIVDALAHRARGDDRWYRHYIHEAAMWARRAQALLS